MLKRVLLLTGSPGVGKTTLLLKIVDILRTKGYRIGGMVSREVRSGGTRIGFEILDLASGKRGWLAHINQKTGPQVGKYRVNLEDLDKIGVEAVLKAVRECDVIAIDEIGPMELFSEKFKRAVREALESGKLLVGVVHWKARDKLVDTVKRREDAETFTVTYENRDMLNQNVVEKALEFLTKIRE
ncbi:MAG: NTPase [Candidatus Bathyarchaeota archaeon]|jgi:nucleoside-triphosphatase|nr:NTPase [Candidatus Bathyarchaeota archaeon A05DMB-3]MDH7607543.1 NTPase [Candidatus Bathyarchaeota archaeon]